MFTKKKRRFLFGVGSLGLIAGTANLFHYFGSVGLASWIESFWCYALLEAVLVAQIVFVISSAFTNWRTWFGPKRDFPEQDYFVISIMALGTAMLVLTLNARSMFAAH